MIVNRFMKVTLAVVAGGWFSWSPALAQQIPQVTGWSFSRSSGSGVQNRSAVTSRSDSTGVQTIVESGNVRVVQRPDGTTAYEVIDPSEKFGSVSFSSQSEEASRFQGLNLFSLSDWGYSVFSN
jgi:hypothetical protein